MMPTIVETSDAAGNTTTTYQLGVGQTARGQLVTSDQDFYKIQLTAGQTYSFALSGTGASNVRNPLLRLYAADGTTLLASDDNSLQGQNAWFTYTAASTGFYYIDALATTGSDTGQYEIAVTAGSRNSFDVFMGAGQIDGDATWSPAPATGVVVTYGYRQSAAAYTVSGHDISTFAQVTTAQMAAIDLALQYWADVCGIVFVNANPGGYTDNASMLFGDYTDASDGSGAFAFFPGSTAATSSAGDVWLNTSVSRTSLPVGGYSFHAILHEIGHAIGLNHPGLYNAAPGVSITYAANALFVQDSNQYSVMSYFDETATAARFTDYAWTPMLFDILAVQDIYGVRSNARSDNTTYGFSSPLTGIYKWSSELARGI